MTSIKVIHFRNHSDTPSLRSKAIRRAKRMKKELPVNLIKSLFLWIMDRTRIAIKTQESDTMTACAPDKESVS